MSSRMPQYRGSSSINDIYAILNPQAFIVVPLLWLGCYSRASAFLNHLVSFPGHKMKGIHGVGWPNQMDYGLDIWDTILRFMHHQTLATYFPLTSRGLTQNVSCPDFFSISRFFSISHTVWLAMLWIAYSWPLYFKPQGGYYMYNKHHTYRQPE